MGVESKSVLVRRAHYRLGSRLGGEEGGTLADEPPVAHAYAQSWVLFDHARAKDTLEDDYSGTYTK